MITRRDLLGRLIGTLGFGIFSSKSCVDYLQARELEQPQRKEYVDVECIILDNNNGLLPPGCVEFRVPFAGCGKAILKFERETFMTHKVEDYQRCGLEIVNVGSWYVEYI